MGKRSQRRKFSKASAARSAGVTRASAVGFVAPAGYTAHRAASGVDPAFMAWNPALHDPNTSHQWERDTEVARTRDLVANNEHAAAAVDRHVAMAVGTRYRYSARHEVMAERLGITPEEASVLASQIEAAWESWAEDPLSRCDWSGDQDFDGMLNLAERHHFVDGEALAAMRFEHDEAKLPAGWKWRSSLQIIDPDRLSNPLGRMNGPFTLDGQSGELINGVETDGRRAIAYHIREAHPSDPHAWGKQMRWERVPARNENGRPIVLHLRQKKRAGERRGVSRFIACLRAFKEFDRFKDSELSNAALSALFGATIKTTKTSGEAGEALGLPQMQAVGELRQTFYGAMDPRLSNGARAVVLAPGDELELHTASRQPSAFQAFTTTTLQGIAASLGLATSQLTMDFSKTTFSAWRGEMLEVWRGILQDRAVIEKTFANLVLFCIVEEAIDNGAISPPATCPDLYENTAGWLAGRWIGPSRGTIDPAGEVDAATKRVSGGFSTLEDEALELGGADYQAVAGQSAYERELWKDKGLTPTAHREMIGISAAPGSPAPVSPPNPEDETDTETADAEAAPAAA